MRECSYCGHANEDAADVCAGCGMAIASTTEARMEARLSDAAEALVIVRIFNTMEEASLLAGRLSASGIEAWIPESGAQPFSSVMAFAHFTVWVAAKDQEEAETIAAEVESSGLQTVSLPSAQGRRALTWRG